jgi:hypothetical protein
MFSAPGGLFGRVAEHAVELFQDTLLEFAEAAA